MSFPPCNSPRGHRTYISYCFVTCCPIFCSPARIDLSFPLILTPQCPLLPMSRISRLALLPVSSQAVSSPPIITVAPLYAPFYHIPPHSVVRIFTFPCSPLNVDSILSTPTQSPSQTPAKIADSNRPQLRLVTADSTSREMYRRRSRPKGTDAS